jgi:hypothetical protein
MYYIVGEVKMHQLYKILIIVMFVLLLSITVQAKKFQEDEGNIKVKVIKTKFKDNLAYVNHSKGNVGQNPHTIKKGEMAKISFEKKGDTTTYDLCFDFYGKQDQVVVEKFEKKAFLGILNENLREPIQIGQYTCMKEFSNMDSAEFNFEATYKGKGILKYDVVIIPSNYNYNFSAAKANDELILLDPYLIGELADSREVLLYMPFDGDLTTSSWSDNLVDSSSVTFNSENDDGSNSATCGTSDAWVNIAYGDDDDFGTKAHCTYSFPTYNSGRCILDYIYEKTANATGAIWEVKTDAGLINYTLTKDCFDYNSTHVKVHVAIGAGECLCSGGQYLGCEESDSDIYQFTSLGCSVNLYESGLYFTNTSNFTAYNLTEYNSSYSIIGDYTIAGYEFGLRGDSVDVANAFNGADTDITYTNNGADFDGDSSKIDLSLNLSDVIDNVYTVCGRFYITNNTADTNQYIFTNDGAGTDGAYMIYNSDTDVINFGAFNSSGNQKNLATTKLNAIDTWLNVCGQKNTSDIKLFVNGVENSSTTITTTDIAPTGVDINIGVNFVGNDDYYNGSIEYLYFYNRTLTDDEILNIHTSGNYSLNPVNETDAAIQFNGLNELVLYNATEYDLSSTSFSFWAKRLNNGGFTVLGRGSFNYFSYIGFSGNNLNMETDTNNKGCYTNEATWDSDWHHYAIILNNYTCSIYIDGVSKSVLDLAAGGVTDNLTLDRVGARGGIATPADPAAYYNGSIDEVYIFDYPLSSTEVETLYGGYSSNIKFTILDADSLDKLVGEDVTIELYNDAAGWSKSVETDEGDYWLNGIPTGDTKVTFFSDNYDGNVIYINIPNISSYNYTLYMTNASAITIKDVLLHVRDEVNDGIDNANIKIYKQNGVNFDLVSDLYTNINGERLVHLVKDQYYYKFTIYNAGVKCYETTNPFQISAADDNIYFTCIIEDDYITRIDNYNNITTTLGFTNTSNITGYFTMEGSSGISDEFCLETRQQTSTGQGYITLNTTCQNTTSFLMNHYVNASGSERDVTYYAIASKRPQNESIWQVDSTIYHTFKIPFTPDWGNLGLLITFLVMIVGFFAFIKQPIVSIMWVCVVFVGASIMKLIDFPLLEGSGVAGAITIVGIAAVIMFVVSKKTQST